MKKLLFSAAIALVAVGGAYAQTYYNISGDEVNCLPEAQFECATYPQGLSEEQTPFIPLDEAVFGTTEYFQ